MQATVMHIITDLGCGGAERMLARLVLADRNAESPRHVVVSLMDGGIYLLELQTAGIECHGLGLNRFHQFPGALLRLVRLMRKLRPDVVMTWLYHADFLGTIAAIASGLGTDRLVWNLRCSAIDFRNHAATTRWIAAFLARISRLPKAVAANSRSGQRAHQELGYRPRHWVFLPNGLDLNEWRPDEDDRLEVRRELGLDDGMVAVGLVARLDPQKDHLTFLAAADIVSMKCPLARFILVGRNTDKVASSRRVLCLGERRDVPRLLRGMDIVVLSSAYGEGAPNVLAEAMATEVACITTEVGDAAALVEGCGVIVPPRNPEALARAITTLVCEDPADRARRGRRARDVIRREHSLGRSLSLYHVLWRSILDNDMSGLGRLFAAESPCLAEDSLNADGTQQSASLPGRATLLDDRTHLSAGGAAELARITGGRWINPPCEGWRPRRVCFATRMASEESLIIPKVASFRYAVDLSRVPAARKASSALLVDDSYVDQSALPRLVVASVSKAVAAMANEARKKYRGTLCAVTGSVGKTSTCELLHHGFMRLGSCADPYFDRNVEDGVNAQLANLSEERFAVLELALSAIDRCGPILAPHIAVLTAIGPAHLSYRSTGSLARTAERKANIFAYLAPGGIAVINRSVPFYDRVLEIAHEHAATVVTYGDHPEASVRLADYDLERQEVTANVGGEEARYQLGMSGRHMAVNSLAVIAALSAMDLDWRKAVAEFANASQPKGRGQRHTVIINGKRVLLIDDTYNANPASMAAAIELLAQLTPPPGGRRIAVLADMLELGVAAARYHAELAEAIVKAGIEKVYVAGELVTHLWDALPGHVRGKSAPSAEGLVQLIQDESREGDIMLFKGSHATGLSSVVSAIRDRHDFPDRPISTAEVRGSIAKQKVFARARGLARRLRSGDTVGWRARGSALASEDCPQGPDD
jgi:UDP-N-acetylmuramoyl-tripeptide--D-alanyl-D-alanine ligase